MSGTRVLQIMFAIFGLIAFVIGGLSLMVAGDTETVVEWTCTIPTQAAPLQRCEGKSTEPSDQTAALGFILLGIGLELAAAAIATGTRHTPAAPVPYRPPLAPGQPPYPAAQSPFPAQPAFPGAPPSAGPPTSAYPGAQHSAPPWPS